MLSPTTRNMGASLSPQPDVSGELNTEALTCIVERLESEIIDGSWIHISYEETDLEMMPFLVAQANKKYPELNLKFVMSVHELVSSIKETRMEGVESARFLVNMGSSGIHISVVDFRVMDGKTSVILFEPAACSAFDLLYWRWRPKQLLNVNNCLIVILLWSSWTFNEALLNAVFLAWRSPKNFSLNL